MENENNIIDDHRNMLCVSKNLSDFHLENLKKWPFIVFNNIKSTEISYNFVNEDDLFFAGQVEFDFDFDFDSIPVGQEKENGLKALEAWSKILFWTDTRISFRIKGKEWK